MTLRGDTAVDEHGVERLAELQLVDDPGDRLVGHQPGQHLGGVVDGVVPLPRARRVRRDALGGHLGAQGALAAALDPGVGGLQEHGEVGVGDEVGPLLLHVQQAVVLRVDLLGLVEDERDVAAGLGHLVGDPQHHGDAALHVDGAPAPEHLSPGGGDPAGGQVGRVGRQRHGVDVSGQHHPLVAAEVRACDDGVADAGHLEVRQVADRGLHGIRQGSFVEADRLDVAHRGGERGDVGGEVEGGGRRRHTGHLNDRPPLYAGRHDAHRLGPRPAHPHRRRDRPRRLVPVAGARRARWRRRARGPRRARGAGGPRRRPRGAAARCGS